MEIKKRFPANTTIEEETFLNDKKIDSEIYALFQRYSMPIKGSDGKYYTVTKKKDLPTREQIIKELGMRGTPQNKKYMSLSTYKTHLAYLKKKGYITESKELKGYIIKEETSYFLDIPLNTIIFLLDVSNANVFKVYIYLGQKWKWREQEKKQGKINENYTFTIAEIAEHCGLGLDNNQQSYEKINNILKILTKLGLISFSEFSNGALKFKRLNNFSFTVSDKNKKLRNFIYEGGKYILKNQEESKRKGYVYIIRMSKWYKIGKTINPKTRLGEYTKLPEEPKTISCIYCGEAYSRIEKELHQLFKHKNTNGEWFTLSEKELNVAIDYLKEQESND